MTRRRVAAALLAASLAILSVATPVTPLTPVASAAPVGSSNPAVTVSLERTVPWTPVPSERHRPLTFVLTLHNNTDHPLGGVRISAFRDTPIFDQQALDGSVDSTDPVSEAPLAIPATRAAPVDIAAGGDAAVTFRTNSGIATRGPDRAALCMCANAVYPIYLDAFAKGSSTLLGSTHTYLAIRDGKSKKVGVSWVWPLIDRPHRLTDSSVFTDDALTASVSTGGRLDKALQVVQDVAATGLPLTVVIDPELVDELTVMSSGYSVRRATAKAVPGTGGPVARQWLARLSETLQAHPNVTTSLTPYADPDIESLTQSGRTWQSALPAEMRADIAQTLGSNLGSSVAWPAGGAVSPTTVGELVKDGTQTVVVSGKSVAPSKVEQLPATLARLRSTAGPVIAALTSPAMQRDASSALMTGGRGLAALPSLLAELAVRAVSVDADRDTDAPLNAFLTPPRYVDPASVAQVDEVIEQTSTGSFTAPTALEAAVTGSSVPTRYSRLRHIAASAVSLSPAILDNARTVSSTYPAARAVLGVGRKPGPGAAATALLQNLVPAQQRIVSAGWRADAASVGGPAAGQRLAGALRRQVASILAGVRIANRENASYTLASTNSPLPVTVENGLPYRAYFQIRVSTVSGLPGFVAQDNKVLSAAADSKQSFRVPTQVKLPGRIQISATLVAPQAGSATAHHLGPRGQQRVALSVHSTVLGTIGVVITVVAAIVLLLALAVRYVRRLQRLRTKRRRAAVQARERAALAAKQTASS